MMRKVDRGSPPRSGPGKRSPRRRRRAAAKRSHIKADNRVSVRPVNIVPTDGPMAAVNSGVSVGERVVVDGTDRLRDGARVIMPAAPSQAPAADPQSNAPNPEPQNPTPNAQPQSPGHSLHQHK